MTLYYVGIDLAERMSAAVIINEHGDIALEEVLDAGAQEKPPNPWKNINAVRQWWKGLYASLEGYEAVYVVETPHFHARNGEPALLVQGGLLCAMAESGVDPADVVRIPAMEWQHFFGFSKSEHGNTKTWAEDYARTYFDYEPGQSREFPRMVKKMREDLIDARMLAEWRKQTCTT